VTSDAVRPRRTHRDGPGSPQKPALRSCTRPGVDQLLEQAEHPHPGWTGPVEDPAFRLGEEGQPVQPVENGGYGNGCEENFMTWEGAVEPSRNACLSGLSVHCVAATETAEFLQLQPILGVRLVLGCDVVPPLALGAGKRQRRSLVAWH
jgi:hypothetical protein